MKSHRPIRLRLLTFSLLIGTAALIGTLAFSAAATASSPSPGSPRPTLAGVTSSVLASHGIEISTPGTGVRAHVSRQAAVAVARAQPFMPSRGLRQALLAQVTYYRMRPKVSGLFWVVSLRPAGDIPVYGGLRKAHPRIRASYYVVFISAATGQFYSAMIG
jgi:hypothetical protein